MSIFDKTRESIRRSLQDFLQIRQETTTTSIVINQELTHGANTALHKVLYRSNAYEAQQAFKQIAGSSADIGRFWSSAPNKSSVRKVRNDLYQMVIDVYADICSSGMNEPKFENDEQLYLWKEIFNGKNNKNFDSLVREAVADVLITGDGAFKVSIDTNISPFPIVEFWDAENVDYEYHRGHLTEIIFKSTFKEHDEDYILEEHYGRGYIRHLLFNSNGSPTALSDTETTKELEDIEFAGDYIAAVPFKIWDSPKYKNRGKPLFDGKIDEIDGMDEVISQWLDALRRGRVNRYIPQDLIPRTPKGDLQRPDNFSNDYIAIGSSLEGSGQVQVIQPSIQYEAYVSSYTSSLERLLTGIISPSTLGIDQKRMNDNATAQRERQRITSWKRTQICNVLLDVVPDLINVVFKTLMNINGANVYDSEITVEFDKYDSPNIEEKIEIASKGAPGCQILTWKQIAEIIADDKTEEEQDELAIQLEALNDTKVEIPSMFPTDYEKAMETAEQSGEANADTSATS